MSAVAAGYPGLRRQRGGPADRQAGSAPSKAFLAPAAAIAIDRAGEVVAETPVRVAASQFGRKVVATEVAEVLALEEVAIPFGPIAIAGAFGVGAYLAYKLGTPPVEGERDPTSAYDMALTWGPEFDSTYTTLASGKELTPNTSRWYRLDADAGAWTPDYDRNTFNGTTYADIAEYAPGEHLTDAEALQAHTFVYGEYALRLERWVDHDFLDRPGTDTMESHTIRLPGHVGSPTFTNPAPTVPGTEVQFIVPVEVPAPWSYRDLTTKPRHVNDDVGEPSIEEAPPIRAWPVLVPPTIVIEAPGTTIEKKPEPEVQADPGSGIAPGLGSTILVPAPARAPPKQKEKERKVRITRNGKVQAIVGIAGEVTEFLDAFRAFYNALPKKYRTGYKLVYSKKAGHRIWVQKYRASPWQRMKDVYTHFDKIDAHKATLFRSISMAQSVTN
jgi:hypothetical protein